MAVPEVAALGSVQLTCRGDVPRRAGAYVRRRIEQVVAESPAGPVLHAHVVVHRDGGGAQARIEVGVDVNGTPVRVHVAAEDVHTAAALAADRLQQRLAHLRDRHVARHRWLRIAAGHSWRHGALRPVPGGPAAAPEERTVVRHTTLAPAPMTPDEAAYDMDLLDHEFLLFVDAETGLDAVVHRRPDGGFGLCGGFGALEHELTVTPLHLEGPLPTLTEEQAIEHLDVGGERFVCYADAVDGRGRVLYRRFDGHLGLVLAGRRG